MSDGEKVGFNVGASVSTSDGEKVGSDEGESVGMFDGEKVGKSVDTCTGSDIRWLVVINVMLMTVRFVQPPSVTLFNVYRKFLENADDSAVCLVMPLTLCV